MSMALTNNDNPLEQSQGNYTHFVPIKDDNTESLGKNMLENPSIKKKKILQLHLLLEPQVFGLQSLECAGSRGRDAVDVPQSWSP